MMVKNSNAFIFTALEIRKSLNKARKESCGTSNPAFLTYIQQLEKLEEKWKKIVDEHDAMARDMGEVYDLSQDDATDGSDS